MLTIRLGIAFICFHSNLLLATSIEAQINDYIAQVEIPRLTQTYPDADISINLNNHAALSYLPLCEAEQIHISNQRPEATQRTNYELRCDSPPWKSFVPVTQKITIDAVMAAAPINRGQRLDESNTGFGKVDISTLRGQIFSKKNPPYGLVASRNIRINTFITDMNTNQPTLVQKGNAVLITASSNTIKVKMNGVALEDGIKGQQIRVRNTSSNRIIQAKVVTDSEVLVNY